MADNFLAKWLSRRAPPAAELVEAQSELDRLVVEQPQLRAPATWLRTALEALEMATEAASLDVSPEVARAKLTAGIPLLRGESVKLNTHAFQRRWQHACAALGPADPRAAQLAQAVKRGRLEPQAIVNAILAGRTEWIHEHAAALELDPALAGTLLRLAVFPDFHALQEHYAPVYARQPWSHGYCPVCGSWPLLGEQRGLDQLRYLRCGLCASAWGVPRLFCPFCETRDYELLKGFHREGEENQRRVACCTACQRYVKIVVTLGGLAPYQLWVADLATLPLDLAAAERGYAH